MLRWSFWILVLCGTAGGFFRPAYEMNEEQKQFYQAYRNLVEINDIRGLNSHVGRSPLVADGVLRELVQRFFDSGDDVTILDDARPLAKALDEVQGGTQYTKRLAYVQALPPDQRRKRQEAVTAFANAVNDLYLKARNERDQGLWRQALGAMDEVLSLATAVQDIEVSGYARYCLGHCHENLGEYMEAVTAYDKAMDEWLKAGRAKDDTYNYMVEKRRELIEKGFDPTAPATEQDATTARNTGTSYAVGSDWIDAETDQKEMRSPFAFQTPSPFSGENLVFWRQFDYNGGAAPLGAVYPCQPFGTRLQIVRDGSKGYVDVDADGTGDIEAKIIDNKPNLVEVKSGEGRHAPYYSLYLATLGQSLQFMGLEANYSGLGVYRPGSYREGEIADEKIIFIDDNCSGTLGDNKEERDGVIRGFPTFWDTDAILIGKARRAVPYSDFIYVGDKLFRLRLLGSQGDKLRVRQLDVDSGFVQVDWEGPEAPTSLVIAEVNEFRGGFFDVAGKDPVRVPVGTYEVAIGKIEAGKKTSTKQAWIFKGRSKKFEVKAGETVVLAMGGPYELDFLTKDSGSEFSVVGKSIVVYDRFGVLVGRIWDELLQPEVSIRAGSSFLAKKKKMSRIDAAKFLEEGQAAAWYPADFRVEKAASTSCEAQLVLKKHGLLGGEFESEWR